MNDTNPINASKANALCAYLVPCMAIIAKARYNNECSGLKSFHQAFCPNAPVCLVL